MNNEQEDEQVEWPIYLKWNEQKQWWIKYEMKFKNKTGKDLDILIE